MLFRYLALLVSFAMIRMASPAPARSTNQGPPLQESASYASYIAKT